MDKHEEYNNSARWDFPEDLRECIIHEITAFFEEFNKDKKGLARITRFNNKKAFTPLRVYVGIKSGMEEKKIPDERWLQDYYNGVKDGKLLTKAYFEALLDTFTYHYNPETNEHWKKAKKHLENDDFIEKGKIIKYIVSKSIKNEFLKEFIGTYKYFFGGRIDNPRYDYIYENELTIFKNGSIEIRNPFNGNIYHGYATMKSESCLQLISYDFADTQLDGIGNLLTFKIDKYAKKVILIPGVMSSFSAKSEIIFAQALLCTELSINKLDIIIRDYFDNLARPLRLYCPSLKDVEQLVGQHLKAYE